MIAGDGEEGEFSRQRFCTLIASFVRSGYPRVGGSVCVDSDPNRLLEERRDPGTVGTAGDAGIPRKRRHVRPDRAINRQCIGKLAIRAIGSVANARPGIRSLVLCEIEVAAGKRARLSIDLDVPLALAG
jgi:hypothetical protein